jgi:hypothetical protein
LIQLCKLFCGIEVMFILDYFLELLRLKNISDLLET